MAEPSSISAEARAGAAINDVLKILAARSGNDFRHYKRGTVLRQVERPMQVTRQPNCCFRTC